LFTINQTLDDSAAISPDGSRIAYMDKIPGRMNPGIFVSRLDGTEKRLLVQLDTWTVGLPLWSPDGNWLAFLVGDTDTPSPNDIPALVNVKTCQVVPLPGLNGEMRGWVK
jgi:Tol biopolymer transport system component